MINQPGFKAGDVTGGGTEAGIVGTFRPRRLCLSNCKPQSYCKTLAMPSFDGINSPWFRESNVIYKNGKCRLSRLGALTSTRQPTEAVKGESLKRPQFMNHIQNVPGQCLLSLSLPWGFTHTVQPCHTTAFRVKTQQHVSTGWTGGPSGTQTKHLLYV